MNKLNELIISGTVGSLVTLAVLASPLFAENKTATPTLSAHATTGTVNHEQVMKDMAEMMEKCKAKMASKHNASQNQHNQHQPSPPNPTTK